jgi:hypothetical protein
LKREDIDVLNSVSDLRSNFQLARLLCIFKEYNENAALQSELVQIHECIEETSNGKYDGTLSDKLFDDFERLFTDSDGRVLQLNKLADDQDVDVILMDCLM